MIGHHLPFRPALAATLILCAFFGKNALALPQPGPCGTAYPTATPYPPLTPPAVPDVMIPAPGPSGTTLLVAPGGSIQTAIDVASPGDRIVLQGSSYTESVTITTPNLTLAAAVPGGTVWQGITPVTWPNCPLLFFLEQSPPPVTVQASGLTIDGLELRGGRGETSICSGTPIPGGQGGPGLRVSAAVQVFINNCVVRGGIGGNAQYDDHLRCYVPAGSYGGPGGPALELAVAGTTVLADPDTVFHGGTGGNGMNGYYISHPDCCMYPTSGGVALPPLNGPGTLLWNADFDVTPTPPAPSATPSPTATPTPIPPTATASPIPPTPDPSPTPAMPSPSATPSPAATPTLGIDPTCSPTAPPCCPGDADNSGGFVDAADFISVQASFGADNGTGGPGDADCSGGLIDAADFIAVQNNFGADCG